MINQKNKILALRIGNIKRLLPFEIKTIGKYDASDLISRLENIDPEYWLEESWRQKTYKAHASTDTLNILWNKECLNDNKKGAKHERNYNLLDFDKVLEDLKPIYEKEFGNGDFHRVLITRLKPKSSISVHRDGNLGLMQGRRTHIPLTTNKNIIFKSGRDLASFHLEVGKVYELNNAKKHAVSNPTNEHRIHLIIDWLQDKGFWEKMND
tara:strand:- start:54 stop:683 length:630 start_codon:yes stop_codon:yes gene_type:complete